MKELPSVRMSTSAKSPKDNNCQYFGFNCGRGGKPSRPQKAEKNEVDEIFVEGMNRLSFDELQREQEDLHGVSADFTEKVEDVNRMLSTLNDHLQHMKPGSAYEKAETMNQNYISNRDFRMTFLRANRYDPKASANQMIRFFDVKSKLFGEDKLTRDILLSDLNHDDIDCLQRGTYQISPVKDRANRAILMQFPGLRAPKAIENELRSRFYINMGLIGSLNTANRSVVYINYGVGKFADHTKGAGGLQFLQLGMGELDLYSVIAHTMLPPTHNNSFAHSDAISHVRVPFVFQSARSNSVRQGMADWRSSMFWIPSLTLVFAALSLGCFRYAPTKF